MHSYINIGSFLLRWSLMISYEGKLYVNPIGNGLFLTVITPWIHDSWNSSKIATDISTDGFSFYGVIKTFKIDQAWIFQCYV